VKAVELWWSRELGRITGICRTTLHLLDDKSLTDVWHWAHDIADSVEAEWERRK
jgi:hypothetical protein